MEIRITCETKHHADLDDLYIIQGELKKLSEENFAKLKNQIINEGFSFPCFVWEENGIFNLLDGTHRKLCLTRLKEEGYEIPKIPIVKIEANNLEHAKKKLLAVTSSYAKIQKEGLTDFLEGMDTEFLDSIELEGITDFEVLNEVPEVKNTNEEIDLDDLTSDLNTVCPRCGFEFKK